MFWTIVSSTATESHQLHVSWQNTIGVQQEENILIAKCFTLESNWAKSGYRIWLAGHCTA